MDGSSLGNPAYGGLLCRNDREWIFDFLGSLGFTDSLQAELAAIHHGLELAWMKGLRCRTGKMGRLEKTKDLDSQI